MSVAVLSLVVVAIALVIVTSSSSSPLFGVVVSPPVPSGPGLVLTTNSGTSASWQSLPTSAGAINSGNIIFLTPLDSGLVYTPPQGVKLICVEVVGGGGAGGGTPAWLDANNYAAGGGGGSGTYAKHYFTASTVSSQLLTIGIGGVAAIGSNGGDGGTSSFGTIISCSGGFGGSAGIMSALNAVASGGDGGSFGSSVIPPGSWRILGDDGKSGWTSPNAQLAIGG